jgi:hypothetical protein
MQRVKVIGVKRWAGTLDGKGIDSAKLFVEVQLDGSRNGNADGVSQFASGIATEEVKLPSSEFLKRIEHTPLPFYVDLDTQRVSNGRQARDVVVDLRLVEQPKSLKAA